MVRWLVVLAAMTVAGCGRSPVAPDAPIDRQATLAPGQSIAIGDSVSVRFVGVQGDSRCPADAICIQGGDALVKLQVARDRELRDVDLHTGNMQPVTSGDLTIALVELSPYPFSNRTIRPDEYRATVRITR